MKRGRDKTLDKVNLRDNRGITLIALIITIIVLLILAGVAFNSLMGNNGILNRAGDATEVNRKENAREKVNLLLGEYIIDKYAEEQTSLDPLYDFFNAKKESGEIDDIIENTNEYIVIEVDGYQFTIDKETLQITNVDSGEITIKINPNGGEGPKITNVKITIANNKKEVDTNEMYYGWSECLEGETPQMPGDSDWIKITSKEYTVPEKDITNSTKLYYLWVRAKAVGGTEYKVIKSKQYNDVDNEIPTVMLEDSGDGSVKVTTTYGFSGVARVAWLSGEKNEADFDEGKGNLLPTDAKIFTHTFSENGWYTVYIEGKNGKKAVNKIQITSIEYGLVQQILENDYADGNNSITIKGVTYSLEVINFREDVTYNSSNPVGSLGNSTQDGPMLVLIYHGNLTIESGQVLIPSVRRKGMLVCVKGTLVNNGTISMTARGAKATGQDVYLWRNDNSTFEFVPAARIGWC